MCSYFKNVDIVSNKIIELINTKFYLLVINTKKYILVLWGNSVIFNFTLIIKNHWSTENA